MAWQYVKKKLRVCEGDSIKIFTDPFLIFPLAFKMEKSNLNINFSKTISDIPDFFHVLISFHIKRIRILEVVHLMFWCFTDRTTNYSASS